MLEKLRSESTTAYLIDLTLNPLKIQQLKKAVTRLEDSRGKYRKYAETGPHLEKIIGSVKGKVKIIKDTLCIQYQTDNLGKSVPSCPLLILDVDQGVRNKRSLKTNLSFDLKDVKANRRNSFHTAFDAGKPESGFMSPEPRKKPMLNDNLLGLEARELEIDSISCSSKASALVDSNHESERLIANSEIKLIVNRFLSKSVTNLNQKPFDKTVREEQMESIFKGLTKPIVRRCSFNEEPIDKEDFEECKRLNNSCTLDYSMQTYNYKRSKLQKSHSLLKLRRTADETASISFIKKYGVLISVELL